MDEILGVGLLNGAFDLLAISAGFAVGDVFGNGAAEEQDFLRDHGHLSPQLRQGIFARVAAVNEQSPAGGIR